MAQPCARPVLNRALLVRCWCCFFSLLLVLFCVPQIIVSEMHYAWSSPAHDQYREFFERVVAKAPGLDEFEVGTGLHCTLLY